MVAECSVPMNFGRQYLDFKGLCDLELTCNEGEVVKASSFPLALNSPVVRELVGTQLIKEVDLEEFSCRSVLTFVESCYTGSLSISRDNFREVNKLSVVFKVQWLIDDCLKFYTRLCSGMNENSLEEVWFLFDEASYILKERNNKDLGETLKTGLRPFPNLQMALVQDFISRDPNTQEFASTELCFSIVGSDTTILYSWLAKNLESKPHPVKLTDVERRFLTSQSLTLCYQSDHGLYQRLLKTVQQCLSNEDLVSLFATFASVPSPSPSVPLPSSSVTETTSVIPTNSNERSDKITYPIVVPAIKSCSTWLEAIKVCDEHPRLQNVFHFLGGLSAYGMEKREHINARKDVSAVFADAMSRRQIRKISYIPREIFGNLYNVLEPYVDSNQTFCKIRHTIYGHHVTSTRHHVWASQSRHHAIYGHHVASTTHHIWASRDTPPTRGRLLCSNPPFTFVKQCPKHSLTRQDCSENKELSNYQLFQDLKPLIRYYYRFGSGKALSPVSSFVNAPYPNTKMSHTRFIGFGDMGTFYPPYNADSFGALGVTKMMEREISTTNFILHFGDISYARGRGYIWDQFMTQMEGVAMAVPYMVGVGNHEYDHIQGGENDPSGAEGQGFHPDWGNLGDDGHGECGVPTVHRYGNC
eukprot:sb/3462913/